MLVVQDEKSEALKAVTLRQSWYDSPCKTGSFISIVGAFDHRGQCIVDDARHYLILHPDHLISATVVADSFSCTRRAVLQDRVKATGGASEGQVYGYILHELFQDALKADRWEKEWFASAVRKTCARYLENLREIQVDVDEAARHLMSKVAELQSWATTFVSQKPKVSRSPFTSSRSKLT